MNTVVEFDVDDMNKVTAITVISEGQLAKEQADKALQVAKESGAAALNEVVRRVGLPVLVVGAAESGIGIESPFLDLIHRVQ